MTNICWLNIGNMKRQIRREMKNQVKVPKSPSPPFPIYCLWNSGKWLLPAPLGMTLGPINGICYIHSNKNLCSCPLWNGKKKGAFPICKYMQAHMFLLYQDALRSRIFVTQKAWH